MMKISFLSQNKSNIPLFKPSIKFLIFCLGLFFMLQIVQSIMQQEFTQQQKQAIRIDQHKLRQQVNMSQQNTQSFTFQSKGQQTFQIQVLQSQIIKGQSYVYWNSQNVYITSDVKPKQHVILEIYQDHSLIQAKQFYTLTAFKFQAQKGRKYTIKVSTLGGSITKLFTMTISKVIPANPSNQLKPELNQNYSKKLQKNIISFQNLARRVTTTQFMDSTIHNYLVVLNQRYFYYQFFELLIVIMAAAMQVLIIKKLLKSANGIV